MNLPLLDEDSVRRALERLRQAEPLGDNPLLSLIWVRQQVETHHPIVSLAGAEVALWSVLTEVIEQNLTRLRRVEGLGSPILDEREAAQAAMKTDFSRGNTELEAWSVLYYRYVRLDLDLHMQTIAHELHTSARQTQRRLKYGVRRLTEQISQLESEARARERRLWLHLKLPPASYASLFGHEELLARLKAVLISTEPPHATVLMGPGGIGKSSVAHAAIRQLIDDDVLDDLGWISLRGPSSYATLLADIAKSLGYLYLTAQNSGEIEGSLRNRLESTRTLLVIDNADWLDRDDLLISELDRLVAPGHVVLVSRREPDSHLPYHRMQAPPLPRDALADLLYEIVRLRHIARARLLDEAGIDAIYRATGGNPLAGKLVASQLAYLPLDRVLENIAGLETANGEALFEALFAPAWADLDEAARRTAIVLGMLPEGAVWNQLYEATELSSQVLDRALRTLITRSLADASGEQPLYRMHALTRQFVTAQAEEPPWDATARDLLQATLAYAIGEQPDQAEPEAQIAAIRVEPATILSLLQRQIDLGEETHRIGQAAVRVAPVLRRSGQWARWCDALQTLADRLGGDAATDPTMQADILLELGIARRWLGEHQAAREMLEEAVQLFGESGKFIRQAGALLELGQLLQLLGLTDPAYEAYQRAASAAHRHGAPALRRRALNGLAALALHNHHVTEALELLEQALTVTSDDEEPDGQTLSLLGSAHLRAGHGDQAVQYQQAALDWFREEGDYPRQARTLLHLGLAYHAQGRIQEALDALHQAMELMRPLGDALGQARALTNLGTIYAERDRWQEAFDTWRDALLLQTHLGDEIGMATTLYNLGDLAWRMGYSEEARRHFEQSRPLAERLSLVSLMEALDRHPSHLP